MFYILKLAKSMTSLLCCRPSISDIKSEDKGDNSECLPIILADAQKWYHRFILDRIVMLPASLYNQFEKGLCIDTQWIINFIESSYSNHEGYEIKINSEAVKCYTANASRFSDKYSVGKFYYTFEGKLELLYNAMFIPEKRKQWDSAVIEYRIEKDVDNGLQIYYMVNKGMMLMKNRDYYEKRFIFYHKDRIYFYSSALPDGEYPPQNDCVRGTTIIDAGMLIQSKNKLEYFLCMQVDPKIAISQTIIKTLLPTTATTIQKNLKAFLEKESAKTAS